MREIVALAVAGAAGTLGRWGLSSLSARLLGDRFPFGTLVVNVVGCLLLGLLMEAVLVTEIVPHPWRMPLTVGFLGAFTTFSAFGYETLRYLERGQWWPALANVGANVVLGLAVVWIGFMVGRVALS